MRTVAAVLLTGIVVLAACGGGGADVSDPAARLLHVQVAAVRAAAAGHDRAGTAAQLTSLRASVARLRKQDEISGDAASRIDRALDAVAAQLTLIPLPTTTTTTTVPPREDDERGPAAHGPEDGHGPKEKPHGHGPKDEQD
jgi:hypothetical protein